MSDVTRPDRIAACGPVVISGSDQTVLDLFARQVSRVPDRPAVSDHGDELSYAELWDRSARVATRLHPFVFGRDQVVGLACVRSAELIIGLLGILRAGAAYLPLDASYPSHRVSYMLDETQSGVVVGHSDVANHFPAGAWEFISLDGLAGLSSTWRDSSTEVVSHQVSIDDLCYVMYTSGSTGSPKGVMLEHGALANLTRWQVKDSVCSEEARTVQFAPISFDPSFLEIFATLASGGTIVCISEEERQDPTLLWDFLAREQISRLFIPFVALQSLSLFAEHLPEHRLALREINTAGEQLQCNDKVRTLFRRLSDCSLVNQYGPTETHVVTRHRLPRDPDTWPLLPPIGTPIDNVRLFVLGEDGDAAGPDRPGELYAGGVAVARGYWGREDLTSERFQPEPGRFDGSRIYRTGDLVIMRPDGEFEFLGRQDDQVKIRGFRVELAEIESILMAASSVQEAAVVVRGDEATDKELVAYVAGELSEDALADVRNLVHERLPRFMVPSRFHVVDGLPRTPSGKLDRRAISLLDLPDPELPTTQSGKVDRDAVVAPAESRLEPPQRPTSAGTAEPDGDGPSQILRDAWIRVLGSPAPEDDASFFAVGGDSLRAARLVALVHEGTGAELTVADVFERQTFAELVEIVRRDLEA